MESRWRIEGWASENTRHVSSLQKSGGRGDTVRAPHRFRATIQAGGMSTIPGTSPWGRGAFITKPIFPSEAPSRASTGTRVCEFTHPQKRLQRFSPKKRQYPLRRGLRLDLPLKEGGKKLGRVASARKKSSAAAAPPYRDRPVQWSWGVGLAARHDGLACPDRFAPNAHAVYSHRDAQPARPQCPCGGRGRPPD